MGKHYLPIQKANTSRKNQWYTHCSSQQLIVPKTLLTTHSTIPHVGLRNTIKDLGVYGIAINSSSRVGCSERSQLNAHLTFTVDTDATARESKHEYNCAGYKLNSQSKCSAGIYRSKDMFSGETGNYDSNYTTCGAVLKGQHHNINSMK